LTKEKKYELKNASGEKCLNLMYAIAGIAMFLIGLAAALWGYSTSGDCKSFGGVVGRIINQNIQQQCQYTPYAQGASIVFLFVGVILMIGGAKSKSEEEQRLR
jgi:hypothetical protein